MRVVASGYASAVMVGDDSSETEDLRERLDVFGAFMGGIIFELDRELRYERVWTAHPGLLALPPQALVGRAASEVLGPREFTLLKEAVAHVDATGEPVALDYVLDVVSGRRSFSAELRARVSRGRATYIMLVRDVTEARALEAKLLQTERLAALGLLAASVMHEIRQPLSYLLTSIGVVERDLAGTPLGASTSASLANIRDGGRRIAEIAGSLDFLAGRRKHAASFDVKVPVQAAIDLCASELAGIDVVRELPDLPRAQGDEGELCQVITNLLLNSAQSFSSVEAGMPRRITLRSARVRDRIVLTVEDNGPGIPADLRPRIFDAFFTTKERGRGAGLGLFVSRSIVEAQGGTLHIASVPGQGTSVEVQLPLAAEDGDGGPPASSTKPSTRRRLSLLIVDDEPRYRESLRLALSADHDVETRDGAAALAEVTLDPTRFDLVLCDMAMAGVDGIAFFEHMSALEVGDRFVLLTAGAFTQRAAEFIAAERCPVVTKPIEVEDLLTLLDRLASRHTASSRLA